MASSTRCVSLWAMASPGGTDEQLVATIAASDGDPAAADALSELYQRYGGLLLGLGMRILRNSAEAEDVVHDVFLEAWKNAAGYDPARASVRTWLTVRMRSRALDVVKSARVKRNAGATPLVLAIDPKISMKDTHAETTLHRGLDALSQEQRSALELAYFDGLSCAEIAERETIPMGTVKSRTAKALLKLREMFEDKGAEP
jgi:RNA polymerase sigma-70 factor, ECF subfamily